MAEHTTYQLNVTADLAARTTDSAFFRATGPLAATVRFDALSAKGVVIGSTEAMYVLKRRVLRGDVSATILGLSQEEIRRVVSVQAQWEYDP